MFGLTENEGPVKGKCENRVSAGGVLQSEAEKKKEQPANGTRARRHEKSGCGRVEERPISTEPRPRGRRRKPRLPKQGYTKEFESLCGRVIAAATDKSVWQAAKERVRAKALCDPRLSPSAFKVLIYLLDHVNREKGCDWHGIEAIAAELNIHERTVQKAFEELAAAKYILRDYKIRSETKASQWWKTTLPALVEAAQEIRQEKASKSAGKDTPKNSPRTRPHGRPNL